MTKTLGYLAVLSSLFLISASAFPQRKTDLEVTVQTPAEPVRGGESFSYSVAVKNNGPAKATEVYLMNSELDSGEIVSGLPDKGSCSLDDEGRGSSKLRCKFGSLEPGESVKVTVTAKIHDFGGEEISRSFPDAPFQRVLGNYGDNKPISPNSPDDGPAVEQRPIDDRASLASVYISSDTEDVNQENDAAQVLVKLLPSKNAPPRVKVLSPKNEAVVVKRAKSPFKLTIEIEAFDPDGTVEKVVVRDPFHQARPFIEDGQYKFLYEGKKYTGKELDDYWKAVPPPEPLATKTGPKTFSFTVTNVDYGLNYLLIKAIDDGGRVDAVHLHFTVKGDASIEIVSPKQNQIVEPGSDLVVETVSKLNEGQVKDIFLQVSTKYPATAEEIPKLELVSKKGNVYRHRYVLKNLQEDSGFTNLLVVLNEDSGAVTQSAMVGFLVRKRPAITVTLIEDGATYPKNEPIQIGFEADEGHHDVQFRILVNGKKDDIYETYYLRGADPGVYTIVIVAYRHDVELSRSKPMKIYVK